MVTQQVKKDDGSAARLLTSVQTQMDDMAQARTVVNDITNQINAHFHGMASSTFQSKMAEWEAAYQRVITAFNNFHDSLTHGFRGIDTGHSDATHLASSIQSAL